MKSIKLTTNERKILNKKMCAVSKAAVSGAGVDYDTSAAYTSDADNIDWNVASLMYYNPNGI